MNKLEIGYIRVSSEFQKIEGHSLKYQENRVRDYFKSKGVKDYKIVKDDGYSAKDEKRPGYQEILKLIKDKKISKLVFLKIDRLSRNKYDYWALCKKALKNDVELVSLNEQLDFQTAVGEFSNDLLLSLAVLERNQMSERVKNAYFAVLEEKNDKGFSKFPFGGTLPFGISKDKDKFLYHNNDIKVVKEMLYLNEEGYSFRDINRVVKEKFGIWKGKNFSEMVCKNTIYLGFKEYKGEKWYFLEPVKYKNMKLDKVILNKRKKRKFTYKLHEYLPNYYTTTRVKTLKDKKTKNYVYYTNKMTGFKMSEVKLIKQIENKITVLHEDIENEKKERMKKLNKLFTLTDMDEIEYNELKREINLSVSRILKISKIKELKVDDNGFITLLVGRRRIEFEYKK